MDAMLHPALSADAIIASWNGTHLSPTRGSFQDWKPERPGVEINDDAIGSSFRMHHLLMPHYHVTNAMNGSSSLPFQQNRFDHRKSTEAISGGQQQQRISSVLIPDSTTAPLGTRVTSEVDCDDDDESRRTSDLFPVAEMSNAGESRRHGSCDGVGNVADSMSVTVRGAPWSTLSSSFTPTSESMQTGNRRLSNFAEDAIGKRTI